MNILEYKIYYEPEVAAGIALDSNTAEDLAKKGHIVHLFVPTPSRGISKEIAKSIPKIEKKVSGRLIIHRYGMYAEQGGLLSRTIRYIICSFKQIWYGLTIDKIDLIFAGSTPPFQGLVCALIKKIKKVPFVFNCQDIFPDSMLNAGIIKENSIIFKIGTIISNITFKSADNIIVISDNMKKNLISKGIDAEKIHIVYNWIDEKVIYPIAITDNKLIKELCVI